MAVIADLLVKLKGDGSELELALDKLHGKMGELKGTADSVQGRMQVLGIGIVAAAAAGTAAFVALGSKARDYYNEIGRLSAVSGMTADATNHMALMFDIAGGSASSLQTYSLRLSAALEQQLAGESNGAADALRDLGVAADDGSGQLRSVADVLPEVMQKLAAEKNETLRSAQAREIFGRGAADMIVLLNNYSSVQEKAGEVARKTGGDWSNATDRMLRFNTVQATINEQIQTLALAAAPAFLTVLEKGVSVMLSVVAAGTRLWNVLSQNKDVLIALGVVATVLVGAALAPLIGALLGIVSIGTIVAAAIAGIATFGIVYLMRHMDTLREAWASVWSYMEGPVTALLHVVEFVVDSILGAVNGMVNGVTGAINGITQSGAFKAAAGFLGMPDIGEIGQINLSARGIAGAAGSVAGGAVDLARRGIGAAGDALGNAFTPLSFDVEDPTQSFKESLAGVTPVADKAAGAVDKLKSALESISQNHTQQIVEAYAKGGMTAVQTVQRQHARLDTEWNKAARDLHDRLGIQVPEEFRLAWEGIKTEMEKGKQSTISGMLGFLLARGTGTGRVDMQAGMNEQTGLPTASFSAGGGNRVSVGNIYVGVRPDVPGGVDPRPVVDALQMATFDKAH